MSLKWPNKDPNDVSDFLLDWAAALDEGDTIDTVTWTITPSGSLIKDSQSNTDTTATIWLSGGEAGDSAPTYEVLCRVLTNQGRTFDQTVKLKCKQR